VSDNMLKNIYDWLSKCYNYTVTKTFNPTEVCIGNSGPLEKHIEEAIRTYDLVVCSVLSGNRNFEARIHEAVKANFLMSPPLVIAFALAGRIDLDLTKEPLGFDKDQHPVFLKDIWPSQQEIEAIIYQYLKPELFQKRYAHLMEENPVWEKILIKDSSQFCWQPTSTYIQRPPFFENFSLEKASPPTLENLRPLAFFGDSVTTDHISPAGAFSETTPAGQYLKAMGVSSHNFNSYGSRRGNHQIMMRGTFANVRLKNRLAEGKEGGYTKLMPENRMVTIFEASQIYFERNVALIIFAGKDYGMGSSRDWAAKGPALLGVKVVVAQSFERIHRTNLIGMGILPLEFIPPNTLDSMNLSGEELFTVIDLFPLKPRKKVKLNIEKNHHKFTLEVLCRLDTQIEIEYYQQGGILPFVLRRLLMHSM
ncbi:MAG: aconitase family protein, partial [Leptospiraceae bacterium]|nr:aconitase family protein [Leptospiraceae bacterium]